MPFKFNLYRYTEDLATREVQRQRSEKQDEQQKQRRDRDAAAAAAAAAASSGGGGSDGRYESAAVEAEELRREAKLLSSELESWRPRAETAERLVLGMSQTITVGQCTLTRPDPWLKGAWYPSSFKPCTYQVKTRFQNVPYKLRSLCGSPAASLAHTFCVPIPAGVFFPYRIRR